MERINSYLEIMDDLVKTEPQAVLIFNKFVQTLEKIQEKLKITMTSFGEVEFRLMKYQAIYMQHLQETIS